ncbi:MAG TPA: ribosome biogenesis GTPase Der [Gemmataceae bacterium]|jgi:GTP-binding protein|nr:ribosome biogenesis GTPase Der [Gemmataceae bacterium]
MDSSIRDPAPPGLLHKGERSVAVSVVAIIGRPNVGKSSLFNWLAGHRIAIVDPTAGVTRDRVSALCKAGDRFFELMDTGGMGIQDVDNLTAQVERQIENAIDQAAVVLFVVDARAGLMPLDDDVARRLRYVTKPIVCVANKCDTEALDAQAAEFYKLGRGKLVCISAQQHRGKRELLELIRERLPPEQAPDPGPAVTMKLAIVGRRNTGKSTFINSLAQSERMIVSEVPGTTRDSVDVRFERDGKVFVAIDTAGVRHRGSISSDIEFYSMARAERSIRRADGVLLFIDPRVRISKVDQQLAGYILDQYRPAVFVVNKWDLMTPMPTSKFGAYVRSVFPSLDYVPIAFITAQIGKNVQAVLNLAQNLHKQASTRVGTGDLNRLIRKAVADQSPPLRQNRRPKIFYGTQVASNPPTIVLFTNGPELFDNTYQRYLLKVFRDHLPFCDVPIKLYLRRKRRHDEPPPEDVEPGREESAPPKEPSRPREAGMDLSGLQFRSTVTDEEIDRDSGHYESELWKDL